MSMLSMIAKNYSRGQPRDSQGRFGSGGGGGVEVPVIKPGDISKLEKQVIPDPNRRAAMNRSIATADSDPQGNKNFYLGVQSAVTGDKIDMETVDQEIADKFANAKFLINPERAIKDDQKYAREEIQAGRDAYEVTQRALKEQGIETVKVYRGVEKGQEVVPNRGAFTSFDHDFAAAFAGKDGKVEEYNVPASQVMFTSRTNTGSNKLYRKLKREKKIDSVSSEAFVMMTESDRPTNVTKGRKHPSWLNTDVVAATENVDSQEQNFLRNLHYKMTRFSVAPLVSNYSAGQPRDSQGRFGSGGGGGGGSAAKGGGGKLDPTVDADGDGVTDAARVGVPAHELPPPPKIPRLPNLTKEEGIVEEAFASAFEKDPDLMASHFRALVEDEAGDGPKTFGTDDAKVMMGVWGNPPPGDRSVNRAKLNTPLHQTANAIAKRAFVQELDTLKPGDELMVTVGGCGAGKGYALKNVPDAVAVKNKSKVVWDSAGDQNATENPWIQAEAEKRGLKVNYVYVHADPKTQWAHPDRGVVKRAGDPKDGRMVDAKVFADSYATGAKNHKAFADNNKNNPNANFIYLENAGTPKRLKGIPRSGLNVNAKALETYAVDTVKRVNPPQHVKDGALIGQRIWEGE